MNYGLLHGYGLGKDEAPGQIGRWVLFCLAVLAIVFRERHYFVYPRFWAEEGVIFFSFARSHGVVQTLLQPHLGYYSLFPNVASIIASKLVSLENAPLATTLMALAGQCLPLALIIFGRSRYWLSIIQKTAVLAVIFVAPLSYEVWLNSINTQFFLCLFTALLLLEPHSEAGGTGRGVALRSSLLVAGLTGILSCLLAPLYWVRACVEKKKEPIVQALILTACMLVQLVVVVKSSSGDIDSKIIMAMGITLPPRIIHWSPPSLGSILLVKNILLNFFGPSLTSSIAKIVHSLYVSGGIAHQAFGYGSLFLVAVFLFCLARRCSGPARYIVPGAFVLLVIPSIAFALVESMGVLISPYAAQRYFFVPNVLVLLMLYCAIDWDGIKRLSGWVNLLFFSLLVLAIFWGGSEFRHFQGSSKVYDPSWPHWKDEIALWKKDTSYAVKIWPAPLWSMRIDP